MVRFLLVVVLLLLSHNYPIANLYYSEKIKRYIFSKSNDNSFEYCPTYCIEQQIIMSPLRCSPRDRKI